MRNNGGKSIKIPLLPIITIITYYDVFQVETEQLADVGSTAYAGTASQGPRGWGAHYVLFQVFCFDSRGRSRIYLSSRIYFPLFV